MQGSRVEEMQILLDEHVLISQTIVSNPDVTPILERASTWAQCMNFTQEILDLFINVQTSFLYLYPIFNSGTIQEEVKDLLDSEKFNKVDTSWHTMMN